MEKFAPKSLVLTGLVLLASIALHAQGTYLSKTYGGQPDNNEGHDVMPLADGGYLLTGAEVDSGLTSYNAFIMRLDSTGKTIWHTQFGGYEQVGGNEITATPDGNFFIAAHTQAFGWGECDALYFLVNPKGDTLWTTTYGSPWNDAAYACMMAPDENYFAVGIVATRPYSNSAFIQKISKQGDTMWTKIYGGPEYTYFDQIRPSGDGNLFVSGNKTLYGNTDFWLTKMDYSGNIIWSKTYGTPYYDISYGMRMAPDGGCLMVGKTENSDSTGALFYVRTDKNGDTLWTKSIPNVIGCTGNSTEYVDGQWLICGEAYNPQHFSQDAYLMRMDDNGNVLWTEYFGGGKEDNARRLSLCANGDVALVGFSYSFGENEKDTYLVRSSASGGTALSVKETENANFLSVQPNPFSNYSVLRFPTGLTNGEITIYDIYGKEVEKIKDVRQGEVKLQREALPAGIYLVQLSSNNAIIQTRKIIAE